MTHVSPQPQTLDARARPPPLHWFLVTTLSSALAQTFTDVRRAPWASEVPLANFESFLSGDPSRVYRAGGPEHFTASAVVFTPDLSQTLLCFHGKGNMWVQLGGHMEPGDASPAQGALREAREESGLADFQLLTSTPIDLDHHGLAATFGACHAHWDIVFALTTPWAEPQVSAESADVRWFDTAKLPRGCAPGFEEQFTRVLSRAGALHQELA